VTHWLTNCASKLVLGIRAQAGGLPLVKPRFKWVEELAHSGTSFRVVIIGGGFSGTSLAYQLLRREPRLRIAVVDSGKTLGHGLAYQTNYLCHLLNVPTARISALPNDPGHFLRWARRNYDPKTEEGSFLPRVAYGRYLESLLKEAATRSGRDLPWFRDQALLATRVGDRYSVRLKSGREIVAEMVVIATGNIPPGDPAMPGLTDAASRYIGFSWAESALEGIFGTASVLLVGAGLTSVDLAMALTARAFHGKIHMLSRRGLLPLPHKETHSWKQFWNKESPRTTRGLMRLIRSQVRVAAEAGVDWRGVIDALRPVTQDIWRSLPDEERRRFMRHGRAYWEVHRHRIAPEVSDRLNRLMREGRIQIHSGRVVRYHEEKDHVAVTLRRRGDGQTEELHVGRVINCTGPEADWRRIDNSFLCSLFAQGLARPDSLFLGLDVDLNGCVVNDAGVPSKSLFAIGPVRKGCLWETTAVPELRKQASDLAEYIVRVAAEERPRKKRSQSISL
jgi:uncharacterized NAD(P)/FAD-binding protein YdhS